VTSLGRRQSRYFDGRFQSRLQWFVAEGRVPNTTQVWVRIFECSRPRTLCPRFYDMFLVKAYTHVRNLMARAHWETTAAVVTMTVWLSDS
jgi:hypothetical protein